MSLEFLGLAALLWVIAALAGLSFDSPLPGRFVLALGIGVALSGLVAGLFDPRATTGDILLSANTVIAFRLNTAAIWLLAWGLVPAFVAAAIGSPGRHPGAWISGAALSLLGALGVAGLQDGVSFLIAWELMSLGGAVMLLADQLSPVPQGGRAVFFMLALLEVGSVALLAAVLIIGAHHMEFATWPGHFADIGTLAIFLTGLLLLIGFGAKLGVLPFYEWYPAAYGSGSGASGAILSGVVLNVAWFALARGVLQWMPPFAGLTGFGEVLVVSGTLTAVLAILYAFQQEDWRRLLAFSSAENGGVAVVALGAAVLFRSEHLPLLAAFAFTVGLLHLAGHSLAKGALMLTADHVYESRGQYQIAQSRLLAKSPWTLGIGALCAAMSLAALPPQAGFVSEWYLFQTIFQAFQLHDIGARLALAFGGAGLALTAAIALAAMAKVFGVGLLGKNGTDPRPSRAGRRIGILALGLAVLAYAVGMPWWLQALAIGASGAMPSAAPAMARGVILVPLTPSFAFISPTLLIVVGPLLALLPLGLLAWGLRSGIRRAPVWAHGLRTLPAASATTALAFSNALREFYSFIYRPRTITERRTEKRLYFIKALRFEYSQAPLFGPALFAPITRFVRTLSARASILQMGSMNAYLAYIGIVLLLILMSVFW
ncbi:MAG: proton-conducting transporter transmembrane domain-containing protein [Acidiferrobacter sp.]